VAEEGGSQAATELVLSFGPVETSSGCRSPSSLDLGDVDVELLEECPSAPCQAWYVVGYVE